MKKLNIPIRLFLTLFILISIKGYGDHRTEQRRNCKILPKYKVVGQIFYKGKQIERKVDTGCHYAQVDMFADEKRNFGNKNPVYIYPAANSTHIASSYPWSINVSGISNAAKLRYVRIDDMTCINSQYLHIVLVSPSGQTMTLISNAGSPTHSIDHAYFEFSDSYRKIYMGEYIGGYGSYTCYAPTNLAGNGPPSPGYDLYPLPGPQPNFGTPRYYSTNDRSKLNSFTGNPNGNWKLFIYDTFNQSVDIKGWSLEFDEQPLIRVATLHVRRGDGSFEFHWTGSNGYSCGSAFTPPAVITGDSLGVAHAEIGAEASFSDAITDTTTVTLNNFDGILSAKVNTLFGSSYRVFVWKALNDADSVLIPQKVLLEGSVRIENGQIVATGFFDSNDFVISTVIDTATGYNVLNLSPILGLTKTLKTFMPGGDMDSLLVVTEVNDAGFGSYNSNACFSPTISSIITPVSCNSSSNGSINITAFDGVAPYSYYWNNGATTEDISGLSAGSYTVTVTDYLSFSSSVTINVAEASHPGIKIDSLINASCGNGNDGYFSFTASGGTGPYLYNVERISPITCCVSGNCGINTDFSCQSCECKSSAPGPYANLSIGTYIINATDSLGCSTSKSLSMIDPPVAGTISGPATQCVDYSAGSASFSIPPVAGATSYTWVVPNGLTIASGQGTSAIILSWTVSAISNGISGILYASANTSCGISQSSVLINLQRFVPGQPGAITGTVKVCPGDNINYSINPVVRATGYTWTVPAGSTIVSGQGSTSITVNYSNGFTATGNLQVTAYNDCGTGALRTLSISRNTPAIPAVINGAFIACSGTTGIYSVANVSGINYIWTVPASSSIISGQGTNSITVNFTGAFTSGTISVKASNGCGISAARTLSILSNPGLPGVISGTAIAVCAGSSGTYSVPNIISGATSYYWTVPVNATITSGQGTQSISVNFSSLFVSGTISLAANNSCGSGPLRSLAISSIPAIPGAITGPAFNNCSVTSIFNIAPVPTATSYVWATNIPGAVVNSSGTSANIAFPAFSTGSVTVKTINSCGMSAPRSLAIKGTVATPALINGNTTVTPCNYEIYSIAPLAGATSYTWTLPSGSTIVSGQGTQSVTVHFGSISGNISVRGVNACGNGSAKSLAVTINSCSRNFNIATVAQDNFENDFTIEPNPFSLSTTVHLNHNLILRNAELVIYDILGNQVKQIVSINDYQVIIEKENMAPGVYFLRFKNNNEKRMIVKFVVQ